MGADYPADEQSTANATKASSTRSKYSLADRDDGTLSDELETMLSLTQTFSFWDDEGGAVGGAHRDGYATDDDDSYGTNSFVSWGTEEERDYVAGAAVSVPCSGVCGDNELADATNVVVETLRDTGRAISNAVRNQKEIRETMFMTKEQKARAKREKKERLEEERRAERERRSKEDGQRARLEAVKVAHMWREK